MIHSSSLHTLKQFWSLTTNRWAIICFTLLALQPLIEASSTIWLVNMMKKVINGENFFPFLYLYLLSIVTPYIPSCIANIIKITWKQEAQRSFINAFVSSNSNQIGQWSNKGIKEEKLSILTTEGPNALHAFIDYVFDMLSYSLNVFFNIFIISIVIEPLFGVAYGLSVVTVFTIMKLKRKLQRRLTQKALTARVDLYQSLLASWDNILLGNLYNFKLWKDKTTQRLSRCLEKNVELERFDQILAITISLISSIPSVMVVMYYAYVNRFDIATLSAFLVSLPVLYNILYYTYHTLSLVFRWNMHTGKLKSIYKAIQPMKDYHIALEKKVKWSKIRVTPSLCLNGALVSELSISSHQDLLPYTQHSGRLTLRGENGAGKSTLLMLVKSALSDRAFFLPTQNQLSFVSETNKYSTGESLKNRLMEILEKVDVDVLLLDEWDANLDQENQEKLSCLIDELARTKCVIEVRHR